jgi:hypothetical protein
MDSPNFKIVREQLTPGGAELISIYFRYGGNFYVFSYPKDGTKKYTLIDAGDIRQSASLSAILAESRINPVNIERIIITHSHPDHYGLAHLLVKGSQAKILVHSGFKYVVEGRRTAFERSWLGLYNPKELKECNIEYLSPQNNHGFINIGGVKLARLTAPIQIGEAGKLEVLAVPESPETHTRDQAIALYSNRDYARPDVPAPRGYRPSDDLVFSGDLWLMRGPMFDRKMKNFTFYFRRAFFRVRRLLQGKGWHGVMVMEQDLAIKEALKNYFSLVRVKPGHGEEFLGSRILPLGLPADRDLFNALGYAANPDGTPIDTAHPDEKLQKLLEQAYAGFVQELIVWQKLGYNNEEIAGFLLRIYKEQTGGSAAVKIDRKQRRLRLKTTLTRLQNDPAAPAALRQLAELTLNNLADDKS